MGPDSKNSNDFSDRSICGAEYSVPLYVRLCMANTSEDIGSVVVRMDASGTEKEEEVVAEEVLKVQGVEGNFRQLLQLLEGKTEFGSETGKSLGAIRVVGGRITRIMSSLFDTTDSLFEAYKEWRLLVETQEKPRLMQRIGSCMTLRHIDVRGDFQWDELEALLSPMQSNPVLDSISLVSLVYDDTEQRIYEILGRILQISRTLKSLTLGLFNSSGCARAYHHLASGLRDNDDCALEKLCFCGTLKASEAKQIAEMILSAPRLSDLRIVNIDDKLDGDKLDDEVIGALAKALAHSTSLKALWLGDVSWGASALLIKALTGEGSNTSITSLVLMGVTDELVDCLPRLLSSNQSLKDLDWRHGIEYLTAKQWQSLGPSLTSSSSLQLFRILVPSLYGVEYLLKATDMNQACVGLYMNSAGPQVRNSVSDRAFKWRRDEKEEYVLSDITKKPVVEIHVARHSESNYVLLPELLQALGSKINAFSSLHLRMGRRRGLTAGLQQVRSRDLEDFYQTLRDTSTLLLLTIDGANGDEWHGGWKKLVDCLHVNTSITHLSITHCDGLDDDLFKQFMGVLQVNLTLKRIKLTGTLWETDGKKALIEEALRQNAEQDSYFSMFKRHKLQFHPAKNGRLFLCGSPFAGKTRLRHTMTRFLCGTSLLGDKAPELWRTKGIEVELLKNDQEMQIAIWDLAGQWIFRTLQDILFPRTNHTSIFLFMFSPYDRNESCIKENLDRCFKSELEEWLRFIASNSQLIGKMLPKVLVVMSHMDKMKYHDVKWAQSILTDLRKDYESILDLRSEELYFVDARRKKVVAPLKHTILEIFRELLREKILAPRICSHISRELAKRSEDVKYCPVWSSQEFYRFCFSSLPSSVSMSLGLETTSGLEVLKAIASYLHDTGSVIIIRSLDRIIVDPNWLTNTFLGELVTKGHNFQIRHRAVKRPELGHFSSRTGFVSSSYFHSLLSSFLKKHPKFKELDESLLEKLLVHFDLCYKLDDGSVDTKYYVPTIVSEDPNFTGIEEPLAWSSPSATYQEFIGFRVQCGNPRRMSMTVALYPRFQIHIRRKLMKEMNLAEEIVICSRNRMYLIMDGHEIFVERSDSHIDVMVKCSKNKARGTAVRDIQHHIVDELRKFCASAEGCPGITLVVGVLRTQCVEQLIPMEHRGEKQSLLIQELKENFENYIMKRLEETTPKSWSESSNPILNYEHSWPPIPKCDLSVDSELARKLLPETEVESVMKKVEVTHEQRLKLVDQISKEMDYEMEKGQDQSTLKMVTEVGTLSTTVLGDLCSSSSNTPGQSLTLGQVLFGVHRMEEKIDRLEVMLGRIERNMKQIISLQHQLQSSLSTFMSKVDQVIGYAESWEQSKTPKRPYLSYENVGMLEKVSAAMNFGTPVRLHLMCESRTGAHAVKDQPGLKLCLEKENLEWLRCICRISSRMLYYLGKAALHVMLGLGQAVPELASIETALPVAVASVAAENIKVGEGMASLERNGNITMKEAWSRLQASLAPHLKENYAELFKLYRVKYLNLDQGRFAWVCDQCMARGLLNGSLECL